MHRVNRAILGLKQKVIKIGNCEIGSGGFTMKKSKSKNKSIDCDLIDVQHK